MQNYMHRKNVELFRKKLAETTDENERQTLKELLAQEEAREQEAKGPRAPKQPKEI